MLRPSILLDGRVWILRVIFNMISQGPRLCVLLLMPDSMSMVASPNLYGFRRLLGRAMGKQPQSFLEKLPNCWVCCWNQLYRKLMAKQMLSISWIECNLWTNPEKNNKNKTTEKSTKTGKRVLPGLSSDHLLRMLAEEKVFEWIEWPVIEVWKKIEESNFEVFGSKNVLWNWNEIV